MTKASRPRYDLLKVDRYASGALQCSRGCPFQCEFCDVIVIYGRRPRTKEPEQLVAELDDMRRAGFHSAFIVDDNFIGNKKKAKKFQNIRGDSLEAKLARIQNAGLDINAGFIVGFDSDDKGIFEDQFRISPATACYIRLCRGSSATRRCTCTSSRYWRQ